MLEAKVYVTLKKTVADPQGLIVKHALDSLGYLEVENVRVGKLLTLNLRLEDKEEARQRLEQMCQKLLSNPIIEDYSFTIKEV